MPKAPIPDEYLGYPVVLPSVMAEIDRRAIQEFGIPALELMENAGKAVAAEAAAFLKDRLGTAAPGARVTVLCGRGNNGGDGLVVARHLKEAGLDVAAFIAPGKREGGYSHEVQENLRRAREAGLPVEEFSEGSEAFSGRLAASDLLVDALLGTGSSGKPAGAAHKMIQAITRSGKHVIAVDVPSGLDPATGHHSGAVVAAALTCALGLPKRGLLAAPAKRYVGELKVLDIGFPPELLRGGRGTA